MNHAASPRRALAVAGANFALIKYWGKRDSTLNLPDVGSISITLDALSTRTEVVPDASLTRDRIELDGRDEPEGAARVRATLDRIRQRAGAHAYAHVRSRNNFPTGAGLASSASGFAALVTAADRAFGAGLDATTRSELARMGSGSAARSIFGGFVEMARGERADGRDAVARPLLAPQDWPLEVLIAVTDRKRKAVGSTEGMQRTARSSPFYRGWVEQQPDDLARARSAIRAHDFDALAEVSEASALTMHGLAMSARPGLLYFNAATLQCLHCIRQLRAEGVAVFFTVDAGPQVKAVCLPEARPRVAAALGEVPGVVELMTAGLGPGAACLDDAAAFES